MLISFMYIMDRTGPRTEPYGTPLVTGAQSEAVPLITTLCSLLLSQFSIHLCTLPAIPSCLTLKLTIYVELYQMPFENQDTQCL